MANPHRRDGNQTLIVFSVCILLPHPLKLSMQQQSDLSHPDLESLLDDVSHVIRESGKLMLAACRARLIPSHLAGTLAPP